MSPTLVTHAGSSLAPADLEQLSASAVESEVDLEFRPPIIRGDLVNAPTTDGWDTRLLILDGQFGQDMAVSVAEVRDYLARGMYLAGASSMGALRAAECRTLGMVAHGWVAQQYLTGRIDADSDVALLMAPVTYEALTVPLVNLRWLLAQLGERDLLTRQDAADVLRVAGAMHYRARMPQLLIAALRRELSPGAAEVMAEFLDPAAIPTWDRKRLDGIQAVETEIRALSGRSDGDELR